MGGDRLGASDLSHRPSLPRNKPVQPHPILGASSVCLPAVGYFYFYFYFYSCALVSSRILLLGTPVALLTLSAQREPTVPTGYKYPCTQVPFSSASWPTFQHQGKITQTKKTVLEIRPIFRPIYNTQSSLHPFQASRPVCCKPLMQTCFTTPHHPPQAPRRQGAPSKPQKPTYARRRKAKIGLASAPGFSHAVRLSFHVAVNLFAPFPCNSYMLGILPHSVDACPACPVCPPFPGGMPLHRWPDPGCLARVPLRAPAKHSQQHLCRPNQPLNSTQNLALSTVAPFTLPVASGAYLFGQAGRVSRISPSNSHIVPTTHHHSPHYPTMYPNRIASYTDSLSILLTPRCHSWYLNSSPYIPYTTLPSLFPDSDPAICLHPRDSSA